MTPPRQRLLAALLVFLGLACSSALGAAEEAPDASVATRSWLAPHADKPPSRAATGSTVGLGRSLAVLLLTGVLGGAALYLRRKKSTPARASSTVGLRVLSSTRVGHRADLVLAEVGGRKILLGVTESAVQKLGWIDADEQADESASSERPRLVAPSVLPSARAQNEAQAVERASIGRSFRNVLKDAIGFGASAVNDSAASQLADQTRDTFARAPAPSGAGRRAPVMVDVEGQARGLLARLKEPRSQ
jgi:flagellar biogenesis protein FliO